MSRCNRMSLRLGAALLATVFSTTAAQAALITFETTPDGLTPVDDADLTQPYVDGATTVTFGISTTGGLVINDNAVFEQRTNDTNDAYISNSGPGADHDADGTGGDWFLRAPGTGNTVSLGGRSFLIEYSGVLPTEAAGTLWDIDVNEQNLVEAFDVSNVLIDSVTLTAADGGDSLPAAFFFSGSTEIKRIRITGGGPLGFDNFNATQAVLPAPAPASGLLALLGLLGIGMRRRVRGVRGRTSRGS